MRKPYRTIEDVLRSPWAAIERPGEGPATDRVLRSTRLEDGIYADLRSRRRERRRKSCPPSRPCPGTCSNPSTP